MPTHDSAAARFAAHQRAAGAIDAPGWRMVLAYFAVFFGTLLAAHLVPQGWWL